MNGGDLSRLPMTLMSLLWENRCVWPDEGMRNFRRWAQRAVFGNRHRGRTGTCLRRSTYSRSPQLESDVSSRLQPALGSCPWWRRAVEFRTPAALEGADP